jgi:hypothetical protein
MSRIISSLLVALLLTFGLAACGGGVSEPGQYGDQSAPGYTWRGEIHGVDCIWAQQTSESGGLSCDWSAEPQ